MILQNGSAMSDINNDLIGNIIGQSNQFNIIYGRRGVGKTTFLIQLALNLSITGENILFVGTDRERDRKIERRLRKAIKYSSGAIRFVRFSNINKLIRLLGKLSLRRSHNTLLILDDVFPIRFLVGKIWTRRLIKQISVLLSLITDVLNNGYKIWISVPEHEKYALPRRWQLFIEFTDRFYRFYRRRRVRILSLVCVENIPSIGSRWLSTKSNIRLREEIIKHLLLTSKGFIIINKPELKN